MIWQKTFDYDSPRYPLELNPGIPSPSNLISTFLLTLITFQIKDLRFILIYIASKALFLLLDGKYLEIHIV